MGEATFLHTGYGVYGRELLTRLWNTGKYEIAELGSYGSSKDSRANTIPWDYYACLPDTPEERQQYDSQMSNQWGLWRFEEVCLHFKPDIVIDVRDWWQSEFESRSPFRNYFSWLIMPTIDSAPQMEQWLATYMNADGVCTYSEFGRDTLLKETNNGIKFHAIASPAANYDVFQPVADKKAHRDKMGIEPDTKIVGTIMRNQKRKLYPDLIMGFKMMLQQYKKLQENTCLYIHTYYPDIGWDLPRLIRESGIAHKILCTYVCHSCGAVFPSLFNDAVQTCPHCGKPDAHLPSNSHGVSDKDLAAIINTFDIYVQYSMCEGFGMPQIEAAACGVPVMAVDYSAMSSVIDNIKGIPIKVQRLFREAETHAYRAYPDNQDFATKLGQFLTKAEHSQLLIGRECYGRCRSNYSWDKCAKIWQRLIDSMPSGKWDSPIRLIQPNLQIPDNLSIDEFVKWCVVNIWCEPSQVNSYITLRMIRDLHYGEAIHGFGGPYYAEDSYLIEKPKYKDFAKKDVVEIMLQLNQLRNRWESLRAQPEQKSVPPYIQMVERRRKT